MLRSPVPSASMRPSAAHSASPADAARSMLQRRGSGAPSEDAAARGASSPAALPRLSRLRCAPAAAPAARAAAVPALAMRRSSRPACALPPAKRRHGSVGDALLLPGGLQVRLLAAAAGAAAAAANGDLPGGAAAGAGTLPPPPLLAIASKRVRAGPGPSAPPGALARGGICSCSAPGWTQPAAAASQAASQLGSSAAPRARAAARGRPAALSVLLADMLLRRDPAWPLGGRLCRCSGGGGGGGVAGGATAAARPAAPAQACRGRPCSAAVASPSSVPSRERAPSGRSRARGAGGATGDPSGDPCSSGPAPRASARLQHCVVAAEVKLAVVCAHALPPALPDSTSEPLSCRSGGARGRPRCRSSSARSTPARARAPQALSPRRVWRPACSTVLGFLRPVGRSVQRAAASGRHACHPPCSSTAAQRVATPHAARRHRCGHFWGGRPSRQAGGSRASRSGAPARTAMAPMPTLVATTAASRPGSPPAAGASGGAYAVPALSAVRLFDSSCSAIPETAERPGRHRAAAPLARLP